MNNINIEGDMKRGMKDRKNKKGEKCSGEKV